MEQQRKRIKTILNSLEELRYTDRRNLNSIETSAAGYALQEEFHHEDFTWNKFEEAGTWGGRDHHQWFCTRVTIPEAYSGHEVMIFLHTGAADIWNTDNPQILMYVNGRMAAAMDMNHNSFLLCQGGVPGDTFELAFYAYSNGSAKADFFKVTTAVFHREIEALWYDMKVLWEAADLLPPDDLQRLKLFSLLNECVNQLDLRRTDAAEFYQSVITARTYLKDQYYDQEHDKTPVTVHSIGHTHIDVAWKWPLRQTRQKAVRSFQTVINLMEEYPEYRFMSSQPVLYEFVKEQAPALYDKIRQRIKEGRWETEGSMWLEADCNLISGESMIRQILYGKQFFQAEFGTGDENEVLWLPDVFGYSAALPQILKKSGIQYFMTTKIGWNEYNQIPHDTMMWRGLDGSEILTYFITTSNYCPDPKLHPDRSFSTTYNGLQNVKQVMGTWQRYQDKVISQDVLTCYGYGDGGGGPTRTMLEESRRMETGVGNCPRTKQTHVKEFFRLLKGNLEGKKTPVWDGELYLEFHRGTYTSMARNKKDNRKCEFLLADAELFSVMEMVITGKKQYPADELEMAWKLVLLNQFHDILPGSSIEEVYQDSDQQYGQAKKCLNQIIEDAMTSILNDIEEEEKTNDRNHIAVFNQLGFVRDGLLELPYESIFERGCVNLETTAAGSEHCLVLPGLQKTWKGSLLYPVTETKPKSLCISAPDLRETGLKQLLDEIQYENGNLMSFETIYYKICFNACGEMVSIYDKEERRELIQKGKSGNQLIVFEDRPAEYDAWNIDAYYEEKSWMIQDLTEFKLLENGPYRACLLVKRPFLQSEITQYIYFYHHTKRIDFETQVDWKEQQLLLKTAFPVEIRSNKAVYEIQFGNVERPTHRNTSWDEARFEVCAHKWADLSEAGFGIALLNDCKFGYDIHDSVMRLTLIKSGIFPNPDADKEIHTFTYSLYPHHGTFREGRVIQEAYDLNCPLYGRLISGKKDFNYSFLSIDCDHVFIDTIKAALDGNGIILRLYEAYGKQAEFRLSLPYAAGRRAYECDCMEKILEPVNQDMEVLSLQIRPYEIKTILVQ